LLALSGALLVQAAWSATECGSGGRVHGQDGNLLRPFQERILRSSWNAERKWLLRLPEGYSEGTPSDVVFSFHGATSTAENQYAYAGFDDLADRDNVILVMPDANKTYPDRDHEIAEYWDSAWEAKWRTRDYDVDFVLELVALLETEYCTGEFYATGMSAGGDITTALQCLDESPFAAFAPVTYRYYNVEECVGAPPRPMLSFHGDEDRVVPISGLDAPWFDATVRDIMQSWADHNNCQSGPVRERVSDEVLRTSWRGCEADVEWYLVEGGGHTWPGGPDVPFLGHTTQDISASQLIWDFFFSRQ